jgi:hypothetical protein
MRRVLISCSVKNSVNPIKKEEMIIRTPEIRINYLFLRIALKTGTLVNVCIRIIIPIKYKNPGTV